MNLSAFYDECQKLPDNKRQWVDVFYKTVLDVFGEDHQSFEERDKVCQLFYGNSSSLSKAQYYRKRNLVRKLYDWLAEQGAVSQDFLKEVYGLQLQDVISNTELYHYYFKDLDEVLDFVTLVGSFKGMGEPNDMLNIKAIVILSWHQVDLNELQEVRKSDLRPENHTVLVGEKQIQLTIEHFNILKRFAELDVHRGFPSQKQQIYMSSPFLMRSAKQISLSPNNIQKAIQRFNSVAVEHGKELSILNLRRNGIFSQVYAAGDKKTANTLIQELTGCDTAFAFGYKEFYERWKRLITGGGES